MRRCFVLSRGRDVLYKAVGIHFTEGFRVSDQLRLNYVNLESKYGRSEILTRFKSSFLFLQSPINCYIFAIIH
jgi:hypothetical protein